MDSEIEALAERAQLEAYANGVLLVVELILIISLLSMIFYSKPSPAKKTGAKPAKGWESITKKLSKKRKVVRVGNYLYLAGACMGIYAAIFHWGSLFKICTSIVILFGVVLYLYGSHCPFCGRFSVKYNLISFDAGYCRKCENTIDLK